MSSRQMSKPSRPIGILRQLAAATVAAALLAQPAAAAAPSPPDAQPPAPAASSPPDAEPPVDLAVSSYASDYSVSLTEAQRRLGRIQLLQEILASIRDLEATRLAGWGIDHTASFGGWVWLTGNAAPNAAATAVADAHADVRIRTGADHSLAELLTAQQGLFRTGAVGRVNDGGASGVARMVTFTGINMAANAVRIGIDPALAAVVPGGLTDTGPVTVTDEAFRAKAAEVTELLAGTISVNYVVEDGRGLSADATFIGGQRMSKCTSGFTARHRGTGVHGIITAAHCYGSISLHGVSLTPVIDILGPDIDARFLRVPTGSSHRLLDEFVCGRTLPCDVTSDIARNRMMGNYVCHYGRNSGNSCGIIDDINFSPSDSIRACVNGCDNTFVRVSGHSLSSCGGDSGGPWYSGGLAYGIHTGSLGSTSCNSRITYAFFSAIQRVEGQLGVDILTRGPVTVP